MSKQNKKIIIVIFIAVVISLAVWLKVSHSLPNDGYLKKQSLDGLSFENAKIDTTDGITTYEVEVVNNTDSEYSLKTIEVTFKDESNKEITTLIGYIGENISVDSKKTLTTSIDTEIENISSITYKINK